MPDSGDDEKRQQQQVWDAAESVGSSMLVTAGDKGPHARPMSAIIRAEDGLIWFMTDEESGKLDEIRADPRASVVFSDGKSTHVVFAGKASVSSERAIIESLWSPAAETFYPAGPVDPDIRLIRFSPGTGELWESPGRIVSLFRMVAAVATGTSARGIGSHFKAPL